MKRIPSKFLEILISHLSFFSYRTCICIKYLKLKKRVKSRKREPRKCEEQLQIPLCVKKIHRRTGHLQTVIFCIAQNAGRYLRHAVCSRECTRPSHARSCGIYESARIRDVNGWWKRFAATLPDRARTFDRALIHLTATHRDPSNARSEIRCVRHVSILARGFSSRELRLARRPLHRASRESSPLFVFASFPRFPFYTYRFRSIVREIKKGIFQK